MKLFLPALALLVSALPASEPATLPHTQPLTREGDLSARMHAAALREMDRTIAGAPAGRARFWQRDFTSPEAYTRSVEPNRERLRKMLGLIDPREAVIRMERFGDDANPALIAETDRYRAFQVRWPVLDGVTGEGILLEPTKSGGPFVIVLGDADQTPEQMVGLAPGSTPAEPWAVRLAERGCTVLIPTLIDRDTRFSGRKELAMTNQPHREWLARPAYMLGRHLIGYEIQKVLAAVDWWQQRAGGENVGVAGYGEGGLLAFYAAAVDPRIRAALVSGYFKPREQTWEEPLYRDVWGLLREFGDAEIASLIAPRGLVIEYRDEPAVDGPPRPLPGQKSQAAPGRLRTPAFAEVEAEFRRIDELTPKSAGDHRRLVQRDSPAALAAFGKMLSLPSEEAGGAVEKPHDARRAFDPHERQRRQIREIEDHIQWLVRDSDLERDRFLLHRVFPEFTKIPWNYELTFPVKTPEPLTAAAAEYRRIFWEEILGKLDAPLPPLEPHSRLRYDEPKWSGYEVTLATGGEGFAWGVLLLPKDLTPGEKRPVVVCQHGRNGLPGELIQSEKPAYRNFAARLVERGFIVLVPHNLYRHEDTYRLLARKGHTVQATHWSVILRHHQQWLAWLASLPQVDARRIGFYGLSFGGEAAMRLPALLEGYCLSICSGDFNDWTRKVASTRDRKSFMFTDEWEIACFGMGSTFSYAELSYLIFPRPFMVERGHHDGVALDSWVASEYAKTRWFYDQFALGDRTAIEFFNGGHAINSQGSFDFLHRHLSWPKR